MTLIDFCSLQGEQKGSRYAAKSTNEEKDPERHLAETQDKAEIIFGKAGDQKQEEGY